MPAGSIQSKQYNGEVGTAGKTQKAQHYSQNFATFNFYFSTQPHEIAYLTNEETGVRISSARFSG